MKTPDEIIGFWREAGSTRWFARDDVFDEEIISRFGETHHRAARRELDEWLGTPKGSLALLLLTDQFPRNMFRDSAHAYATDSLALFYADRAIVQGHDQAVSPDLRLFFYLPFEHSEDATDQERAVKLFRELSEPALLKWAITHQEAILKFGRFPGRNHALGRQTTPAEQVWLDEGGGGFS